MNAQASTFQFGLFSFDTAQQELRQRGRRVRLSVSLIKLLTLFLSRPGELVTREQIADALWENHGTVDVAIGINTAVRRLRAILDDDPTSPRYIETVIGLGYRFVAEVEEFEATGGPLAVVEDEFEAAVTHPPEIPKSDIHSSGDNPLAIHEVAEPQSTGRFRFLKPLRIVLGAALLLLGVGIFLLRHRSLPPAPLQHASVFSQEVSKITFNSDDNRITTEAVSPDGHMVAYGDRFGTSLHSLDSGADRLLTSPSSFLAERISWSPDLNMLVVSGVDQPNRRSMVWSVYFEGQPPRVLFSDAGLATVSPDGRSIAYTRTQNTEIWIADGLGQNSHVLVPRGEGESFDGLLWSPKSNRLVFNRVSEDGAGNVPGSPSSADSDAPRHGSYESVDAGSGKLLSMQRNIRFDSGVLLNDGSFIFAINQVTGGPGLMMVETDPDSGRFLDSPQPVTPPQAWDMHENAVESLSASANGKTVGAVLARHTADTFWANIDWPGPTLKGETRLTGELGTNYPHAWSPNGDAVVFDGDDGASLIGKQRLGESKLEIMAKLPNVVAMANFSPDGKWVLFADYTGIPVHVVGIFRIPAAGGPPRQLPTTGTVDEFQCSVSFSGSCVMRETVNSKEFVFYALDPVRGMGKELGRINWEPTVIGDWSLSPDGSTVAMADHDPDHPAIRLVHFSPQGPAAIAVIPVRGFGVVRESTWASDAKGFFVETKTASGFDLLYVNLAGHATVLRQSQIAIWGVPSRDGKKLAFPGQTVRSNVWIGHTSPPNGLPNGRTGGGL